MQSGRIEWYTQIEDVFEIYQTFTVWVDDQQIKSKLYRSLLSLARQVEEEQVLEDDFTDFIVDIEKVISGREVIPNFGCTLIEVLIFSS